ncbi:MAG: 3-phosphoshikimate 1-carboxyvinyltransferase, partial [Candidatus Methanomethyliaceae archaeon]|nr:3-phosphoshikimate 1-carboxyvinyltransferase [Candidatus Methanomethyliaceae archaeon]
TVLTGDETLRKRPVGELLNSLNSLGVKCYSTKGNGLPPVVVMGGGIEGGRAYIRGDVSSQFISALLISCTKAKNDTILNIIKPIFSKNYIEMSLKVLSSFGADIEKTEEGFLIKGNQKLTPCDFVVEGDYSSAAFLIAAGLLMGDVSIEGLNFQSLQGDRRIIEILNSMGGEIEISNGILRARKSKLNGLILDMNDVPDLVPIIAVVATQADGTTIIKGIERLRLKESDRIITTTNMLRAFGAMVNIHENTIIIHGPSSLKAAKINPFNDHRIAMASAIASLIAKGESIIENAECVSKSYPSFFDDLKSLGAKVEAL